MMRPMVALIGVVALAGLALAASQVALLRPVMALALPATAAVVSLAGMAWRVVRWAGAPVPFRIPVTAGQQGSFDWLAQNRFDNPSTTGRTIVRVALEVLLFRSLLRNATLERHEGGRLVFREAFGLWLASLAFHYSLLVIAVRHLRFVLQPVPAFVSQLAALDGFLQTGIPTLFASDVVLLVALGFLLARRLREASLRYMSLVIDYVLPFLLLGIAVSGLMMRHVIRVDTAAAKDLALGLVCLSLPAVPASIHPLMFVHLALVSVLLALLPFSKLIHMAGAFLSPTRNLANNSRARRHVNPWNGAVDVHTYAQWEDEFRDKMLASGVPLDAAETMPAGGNGGHRG